MAGWTLRVSLALVLLVFGAGCGGNGGEAGPQGDTASPEDQALGANASVEDIAAAINDAGVPCAQLDPSEPKDNPKPTELASCTGGEKHLTIATFEDDRTRQAWASDSQIFGLATYEGDTWVVTFPWPVDYLEELDNALGDYAELTCGVPNCFLGPSP